MGRRKNATIEDVAPPADPIANAIAAGGATPQAIPRKLSTSFIAFDTNIRNYSPSHPIVVRDLEHYRDQWAMDRLRHDALEALLREAASFLWEAERELGDDDLGAWNDDAVVDKWLSGVRAFFREVKEVG